MPHIGLITRIQKSIKAFIGNELIGVDADPDPTVYPDGKPGPDPGFAIKLKNKFVQNFFSYTGTAPIYCTYLSISKNSNILYMLYSLKNKNNFKKSKISTVLFV